MNFLSSDYSIDDNEDYFGIRTHSRYVLNIYKLIKDKEIQFSIDRPTKYSAISNEQKIIKKLEITRYTLESIKTEKGFSEQEIDFLPLSLSWLWIKGYYAIFHLISLLISLENNDSRYMLDRGYNEHSKIISKFNNLIVDYQPFNLNELNRVFSGSDLSNFKTLSHVNIRDIIRYDESLYKLSLKKVYREESKVKLKKIRGIKHKREVERLFSKQYSIFDLFHYYRERFNYIGFQYLDCDNLPYNGLELQKFYFASYGIITIMNKSIVKYLISRTSSNISLKLHEIVNVL